MLPKKNILIYCVLLTGLVACVPLPATVILNAQTPLPAGSPLPPAPQPIQTASPATRPAVPDFTHIVIIFFENHEYDSVIGNRSMPYYNQLAGENTLLTQYYAVAHPSLPNYIATIGGDTFGINTDCTTCFLQAPSLVDQVEASGRTWRAYLEDLPRPC
jgi:acid phosphatase